MSKKVLIDGKFVRSNSLFIGLAIWLMTEVAWYEPYDVFIGNETKCSLRDWNIVLNYYCLNFKSCFSDLELVFYNMFAT